MAAPSQRKVAGDGTDPRDQFEEGIGKLLDLLQPEPRMTEAEATAAGFVPLREICKALGVSNTRARGMVGAQIEQGNAERVKVQQAYWYRRVSAPPR